MPDATLRRVSESEKPVFSMHFQDYLAELAAHNGARPDRRGLYYYDRYDLYWGDPSRSPFFVECDGQRAGLVLLRELPDEESPTGGVSLQVAEICIFPAHRRRGVGKQVMRLAAEAARERRVPLTWSAYMTNEPATALYSSVLEEFGARRGVWVAERSRGIDGAGLARFYYQLTPVLRSEDAAPAW